MIGRPYFADLCAPTGSKDWAGRRAESFDVIRALAARMATLQRSAHRASIEGREHIRSTIQPLFLSSSQNQISGEAI